MKEIEDKRIFQQNMKKKAAIEKKIRYEKKSLEKSSVAIKVTNYDKRKLNPNQKVIYEILDMERSNRKLTEINSLSSFSNDDWTLKKPYFTEMKNKSENLWDIKESEEMKNEYNILVENKINERQNQEINNIKQFIKYIILRITLSIIVYFVEKLIDIIHFILDDLGIIDIMLKFKINTGISSFILTSTLIISDNILNNISFYLNKINIESIRREEKRRDINFSRVVPQSKIDPKKMA